MDHGKDFYFKALLTVLQNDNRTLRSLQLETYGIKDPKTVLDVADMLSENRVLESLHLWNDDCFTTRSVNKSVPRAISAYLRDALVFMNRGRMLHLHLDPMGTLYSDGLSPILKNNQAKSVSYGRNWIRVIFLLSFLRANRQSTFRDSIMTLEPIIIKLLKTEVPTLHPYYWRNQNRSDWDDARKTAKVTCLSKFARSKFARAHVKLVEPDVSSVPSLNWSQKLFPKIAVELV